MTTIAITGNTYPVKDQLKALGARWNPDAKAKKKRTKRAHSRLARRNRHPRATAAATTARRNAAFAAFSKPGILAATWKIKSSEAASVDCYEERKMGY